MDGRSISSPAIGADGTVYVGSTDNNLYALNPADGSVKWNYPTGNGIWSSPALGADGTIYVGSFDDNVYTIGNGQPTNNPPTLDAIANQTVNENCGAQTINLTGISAGNVGQTVIISATSGNTALIPNPTLSYNNPSTTGTLSYTPVTGASGNATITVTVTNSGGLDTQVQFTITVNPVTHPPTLDAIANQTVNENCGAQTINLTGISAGNAGQTVTISATSGNIALIPNPTVSYSNPSTTGTLSLHPGDRRHRHRHYHCHRHE